MLRKNLLIHIQRTYGPVFIELGVDATDTPESLFYVLNDAEQGSTNDLQKFMAERGARQFLIDKAQMLEVDPPDFEQEIAEDGGDNRSQ